MLTQKLLMRLEALNHAYMQEEALVKEDPHNSHKGRAMTIFFPILYIKYLFEEGRMKKVFQQEQTQDIRLTLAFVVVRKNIVHV